MGTRSFPRVKWPGRGADYPSPAEVLRSKECRPIPPRLWAFESVTGYIFLSYAVHTPKIPVISVGKKNIPIISKALVSVPSSTHTDIVIHFVILTSLSQLSYFNGSHRTQNK
jgi:hypothetical protein